MSVKKSDDKLKSLLRNDGGFRSAQVEEINVSEYISPVANIKVVGIGGA